MNIVKSMLSKQVWDNIAQENYFRNIGLECTDILSLENRSHDLFFNGCIIIKHSWLFLFNVGSAVNLRLVWEQWTGASINGNVTNKQLESSK